jgi:hypothetical protein
MSKRLRILLAIAGAALICLACSAIAYAGQPLSSVQERIVIWSDLLRMP